MRGIITKLSQRLRRLDERQRKPTMHTVITDEQHTCVNCGTTFVGRFCPQCGLPVNRQNVSSKNVLLGFLDIWGFGSRSMLRSIHELFWRPGYMIRDYLNGHQPLYFPPFKMLIIMTLIFALVASLRGGEPEEEAMFIYGDVFLNYGAPQGVVHFFARVDSVLVWLHGHAAYQAILAGVFYIVSSWLVFRRRMSFFEVFFSQLYISCQMQLVGTLWMLIVGREPYYNLTPFAVPLLIGLPLLCYDYHQLYGLRLWASLWRTLLTFVLTLLLMLTLGALPILIVKYF